MTIKKNATPESSIDVIEVAQEVNQFFILGTTPLIMNRLAEKARHELLMPRGRKNAAERATTLKHDPYEEFRAAAHLVEGDLAPTLLGIPAASFKRAMAKAALDLAGTNKSQIDRLLYVKGNKISVWGVPHLLMAIVRSADMAKTPDVRSRPILPTWACEISVHYTQPLIKPEAISRLLVAAGITIGVGDWRQEKGSGNFGLWELVGEKNQAVYDEIVATGGRAAQQAAFDSPIPYDRDTADLLTWFNDELRVRRVKGAA